MSRVSLTARLAPCVLGGLLLVSASARAAKDCTHVENAKDQSDVVTCRNAQGVVVHTHRTVRNSLEGQSKDFTDAGKLKRLQSYKHGTSDGRFLTYSDDGAVLLEEQNFKDGKRHGVFRTFFEDGKPKTETHWAEDVQTGVAQEWWPGGKLKEKAHYKEGLLSGERLRFRRDGTPESVEHFEPDPTRPRYARNTGTWRTFHPNGKLARETSYREGRQDGLSRTFSESGQLTGAICYRGGTLDDTASCGERANRTWFPDGKLHKEWRYGKGIAKGYERVLYRSGQVREVTAYVQDLREGKSEEFYENGKLAHAQHFHLGKQDGEERTFFEEGQPETLTVWKAGAKVALTRYFQNGNPKEEETLGEGRVHLREFADDGKLAREGDFLAHGLEGSAWGRRWDGVVTEYADGKPVATTTYKDGKREGKSVRRYPDGYRIEEQYAADTRKSLVVVDPKGKVVLLEEFFADGSHKTRIDLRDARALALTKG